MDKTRYGFGIILLIVEALIIIQMAITGGYHSHAKATDNVGNNNAQFVRGFHVEENILRKKHPGKCTEVMFYYQYSYTMEN
jgi:hypothetical protein